MSTEYRRKFVCRGLCTEQNMRNAFKGIDEGMNVSRASKHYFLPRKTLHKRCISKNFKKIKMGLDCVFEEWSKNRFVRHIKALQNCCFTLFRDDLRNFAYEFADYWCSKQV